MGLAWEERTRGQRTQVEQGLAAHESVHSAHVEACSLPQVFGAYPHQSRRRPVRAEANDA